MRLKEGERRRERGKGRVVCERLREQIKRGTVRENAGGWRVESEGVEKIRDSGRERDKRKR